MSNPLQARNLAVLRTVLALMALPSFLVCTHANAESKHALENFKKYTEALNVYHDSARAAADGYIHYDGYDTFSMGEHWYNRDVFESGICTGRRPSHLQYLVIDGVRELIGAGYVCLPADKKRAAPEVFAADVKWHTHGPAWCLLPNGAAEDFVDLANAVPNELTSATWQTVCQEQGGQPALQNVRMVHTWNWIPAPNGLSSHENLAIPFLRAGLPTPSADYLDSAIGLAVIRTLRLAHGDTQWWYWRGFNVIGASDEQKREGWRILEEAKLDGQGIQKHMVEPSDSRDLAFKTLAVEGDRAIDSMRERLTGVFTAEQMRILKAYIDPIQAHVQHGHEHH